MTSARPVVDTRIADGKRSIVSGSFPRELRVLIELGRRLTAAGFPADAVELVSPDNWEAVLHAAARHGMLPLVAAAVARARPQIPTQVDAALSQAALANAARVLSITGELIGILEAFREQGILAVPYKGPVLSLQLYGSIALRQAGDVDVIVRRRDVDLARRTILANGYSPGYDLGGAARAFMLQSRYSESFVQPERAAVELHWAFTNQDIGFPLELEGLSKSLRTLEVAGHDVPVFCIHDLLLILCVHGTKHRWDRLELICCLAAAIRAEPMLDWERVVARSAELGVRRMLLLGVLLAHSIMEAPIPRWVRDAARGDPGVAKVFPLITAILAAEVGGLDASGLATDLFRYRLRERWRDRARFAIYRVTTPSRPERWLSVSLGRRVVPLHGFVRPFQLMRRAVLAVGSRLQF